MYEIRGVKGTIVTNSEKIKLKDDYVHDYIELKSTTNKMVLSYKDYVTISEIRVYSTGGIPDNVQQWKKEESTDLMLFSTHSDDEVLFFGGILPTYVNQGKKVHVVYLTRHDLGGNYVKNERIHEQLDGLWTSGVRDYPTFGIIKDAKSVIKDHTEKEMKAIIKHVQKQLKKDKIKDKEVIDFYVELLRKYKPQVVLGHDEYGEYGHGQHVYNTYILKQAVEKSKDKKYKVKGLEPFDVSKFYIHLYNQDNSTIINLDTPLEKYNNRTAYQVTCEAFTKHLSQQKSKYPAWLYGEYHEHTKASDIDTSNPMYWGLYYSTVGEDINKNDLFENID